MKTRSLLIFCLIVTAVSFAQEKMSKADKYFYGYSYRAAIAEYKKEMTERPLNNSKLLNLADSYYKIGDFKNASDYYLDVNKKDTTMSVHRFNKLLQSLAKTSNTDRVKTFYNSKKNHFSNELLENAEFNYELLGTPKEEDDIKIFNIAENSPQADFAPAFYKKDRFLFSSGRLHKDKKTYEPSGESYLDIYVARLRTDGSVLNSSPYASIPKTKFHEATPYFSEELEKLFYVLSNSENGILRYDENGKNSLAIGMANANGDFSYLLKDLSTSFYYPFYDAQNEKLYFAANLEDSYGGTDLYFVNTNKGQIMSQPYNLGPRINSPGNEIAPYILNNSFFFSSDVFYGIGGMDIYKANIDSDGSFGVPVNLGISINSSADDFGFILREDDQEGLLGYFSSNRKGGKGKDDIYGVRFNETPGLKTFSLKGNVVNLKSNRSIDKAQVVLFDSDGTVLKEVYTNEDGQFRVELPWRDQITVQATKDRYSTFSATYGDNQYHEIQGVAFNMGLSLLDDLLSEKEDKTVIKLQKFYFDKGKASITSSIQVELDKVIEAVQRFPQLKLAIENHTNSKGYKSTNKKLSQKRADAIKFYLLKKGLTSSSIVSSIGFGEEKLMNRCEDGVYCLDFLHKQNDRTLIVVHNAENL